MLIWYLSGEILYLGTLALINSTLFLSAHLVPVTDVSMRSDLVSSARVSSVTALLFDYTSVTLSYYYLGANSISAAFAFVELTDIGIV